MKIDDLSHKDLTSIATLLKALSDPTRLKILRFLHNGEQSVNDIVEGIGELQANTSKHLRVLTQAKVLKSEKRGKFVYYQYSDPWIGQICDTVCGAYNHLFN